MQSLKRILFLTLMVSLGVVSCTKEAADLSSRTQSVTSGATAAASDTTVAPSVYTPPVLYSESSRILVDASRDGGGWWYPQSPSTGFSASDAHQGKALADYLRSLGFRVDELPRGALITPELLDQYDKVIRAGGAGSYTASELAAYDSFLVRSSALLLIQDHQKIFPNDALAGRLRLPFTGAQEGTVTRFYPHEITTGVTSHPYIAGSVITNPDRNTITVLGSLSMAAGGKDSTEAAVMGILHHPTSRVFFIGDINGLEQVPQPLTANVVKWLFQ